MSPEEHPVKSHEPGDALSRREFSTLLAASAAMALTGCATTEGRKTPMERPNVLLILADDFGYEVPGCNGGTSYSTPNIDALAAGGTRFVHCYSSPVCSPTRVNLLTGRYGFRTTEEWAYIPPAEITIGHVLGNAGYATGMAGKWQLAVLKDDPQHVARTGFAENCCWGWHEGPRYYYPCIRQNGVLRTDVQDRYGPDVFCEFMIDFMSRHRNEPFLAYYPSVLTHFPKGDEPPPAGGKHKNYAEMVAALDEEVGKLVAGLDALGLRERTLILFTGDNGTPRGIQSKMDGTTIVGGKGAFTDAGTHVPLIANWPGVTPAGRVSNDLVDFSDFLPTLAELAGALLPNVPIDGKSFAPQLRGLPGTPREWAYVEYQGTRWARDQRWKLYGDGTLYDMANDPFEERPVPPDSVSPEASQARQKLTLALAQVRS